MSAYTDALAEATTVGTTHCSDPALMAQFLDASGVDLPELVWGGAQKSGLSTRELAVLLDKEPAAIAPTATITPTPEQIAVAELNGRDPQEVAENSHRTTRVHELMRKHSKAALLRMAFAGGLADVNNPAQWTKQELAATVEDQEWRAQITS